MPRTPLPPINLPPIIVETALPTYTGARKTTQAQPAVTEGPRVGGAILYMIRVCMEGSDFYGLAMLSHYRQFTDDELKAMTDEAAKITNQARIGSRRKEMADMSMPVHNPSEINENLFKTDLMFFETVMSDKFSFEVIRVNVSSTTIESTIKGAA